MPKRRTACFLLVLLFSLLPGALAVPVDPEPTSSPLPVVGGPPSFSCVLRVGDTSYGLWEEMLYYNSPRLFADGILQFVPLNELYTYCLSNGVPCYSLEGRAEPAVVPGECCTYAAVTGYRLYRLEDGVCVRTDCSTIDGAVLEPGGYLLLVDCSVSGTDGGGGRYAGLCFPTVGDVEPIAPTPTPGITLPLE